LITSGMPSTIGLLNPKFMSKVEAVIADALQAAA
jgi:hypothetical protein